MCCSTKILSKLSCFFASYCKSHRNIWSTLHCFTVDFTSVQHNSSRVCVLRLSGRFKGDSRLFLTVEQQKGLQRPWMDSPPVLQTRMKVLIRRVRLAPFPLCVPDGGPELLRKEKKKVTTGCTTISFQPRRPQMNQSAEREITGLDASTQHCLCKRSGRGLVLLEREGTHGKERTHKKPQEHEPSLCGPWSFHTYWTPEWGEKGESSDLRATQTSVHLEGKIFCSSLEG